MIKRILILCAGVVWLAEVAAADHPVLAHFQAECLRLVEAETQMAEADHLFSDTHNLRWKVMKSGTSSCVVSLRDDHVLSDDRRAEEQAARRAEAEDIRTAAPVLVEAMIAQGYELCFDQSTDAEHNTLLRKFLDDGRSVNSLIWVLPHYPISAMNAGILSKEETAKQPCETELS